MRGLFFLPLILIASTAQAADWITVPSYFTHDPQTGERVAQYLPSKPVFYHTDPTYRQSGYHHTRSSVRVGQSADHYHLVEEWGRPVRPYGEWQFPYRPYSVPYDLWGSPFGGLTIVQPYPYGDAVPPYGRQPYGPGAPRGFAMPDPGAGGVEF